MTFPKMNRFAVLLGLAVWTLRYAVAPAAPPAPAATSLSEVDDDFFFQGEFSGQVVGLGRCGLQLIAEGGGAFRGVLHLGGLPGDGGGYGERFEFPGRREASTVLLSGDDAVIHVQLGSAVVRDGSGRQRGFLQRVVRRSPTLGLAPPTNARVLFDGTSADAFADGKMSPAGYLMHGAETKLPVSDFHLHLEFRTPYMPTARGQARGNSGVYIQRRYEVQVLDSFGLSGETN